MRATLRDGSGRTFACALAAVALGGCTFGIYGFRAEPT